MLLLLLLFAFLPTLIWLLFFLREDDTKPEPTWVLALTFALGMAITPVVYYVEKFYQSLFSLQGAPPYTFWFFLFVGLIEELAKWSVIYFIIRKNKAFDEPIDAMVYLTVAALGFATVENVLSISSSYDNQSFLFVEVGILRLLGATLLHVFASCLVGFYWGRALLRKTSIAAALFWGLTIAILFHAMFDYLISRYTPLSIPLFLLVVAAFFVFRDFERLKPNEEMDKGVDSN